MQFGNEHVGEQDSWSKGVKGHREKIYANSIGEEDRSTGVLYADIRNL